MSNIMNPAAPEASAALVPEAASIKRTGPRFRRTHKANYVRGLIETYTVVYPQLQHLDFTRSAARLEVPVYFFEGRKDVNAMISLW